MSSSSIGTIFKVTTFGESHGPALGAVIDGCPAGLALSEELIQPFLDRRRPGQGGFSSPRDEADRVEILSGVFEGRTTGAPIALLIRNEDARPEDYEALRGQHRPGHADAAYDAKYGFRDHRGGGRASGRETVARVAAGAVASLLLAESGITVRAYARSIGPVTGEQTDLSEIEKNALRMADARAAEEAAAYLANEKTEGRSVGGSITCVATGVPAGLGEPVFGKLDAELAKAVFSIGAVKAVEIGDCVLGGISTGEDIVVHATVKPTPSVSGGRFDVCIVPRAVPVVEAMVAIVLADMLLLQRSARLNP